MRFLTTRIGGARLRPINLKACHLLPATLFLGALTWVCGLVLPAHAADPKPAKHIYLAPDDRTDYLWALDEEGYRKALVEMLDYYLDRIDATADQPPPYQGRWNCDGSFSGEPQRFSLALAGGITSGKQTTHIETDLGDTQVLDGLVPASAAPMQMLTFGLVPRPSPGARGDRRR